VCREPINKGKAQIDVFGRTAGGHVKLPAFWQELLDRGLRSFEGQGRARVDVAANELFGGKRGAGCEQQKSKEECTHDFLPCCLSQRMISVQRGSEKLALTQRHA
jgi:hypothetical protein